MSVAQNVVWYIFVNLPCEHENNVCSVVAIIHRCELYPVHKCYFLNIYLAVLCLSCSMRDLHCILWNLLLQLTDSLVVRCRLSSWGLQALKHVASAGVAMGLVAPWHVGS